MNRCASNRNGEEEGIYDHVFGRAYHLTALSDSLNNTAQVLPISIESVPDPGENYKLRIVQAKKLAGRPSTHRRASSIDAFRTGAKPKKPKPEPLSQEKENLEPLSQEKENLDYRRSSMKCLFYFIRLILTDDKFRCDIGWIFGRVDP